MRKFGIAMAGTVLAAASITLANSAEDRSALDPDNYCSGENLNIYLVGALGSRKINLIKSELGFDIDWPDPYSCPAEGWPKSSVKPGGRTYYRSVMNTIKIPGKFRVDPTGGCESLVLNSRSDFALDLDKDLYLSIDPCTNIYVACKPVDREGVSCRVEKVQKSTPPVRTVELENKPTEKAVFPPYQIAVAKDGQETYGRGESYTKEIFVERGVSVGLELAASAQVIDASVKAEVEQKTGVKFGKTYTDTQEAVAVGKKSDGSGCRDWAIYLFDVIRSGKVLFHKSAHDAVEVPFSYIERRRYCADNLCTPNDNECVNSN